MLRPPAPPSRRTAILLCCGGLAALAAVHARVAGPWNPLHSCDTVAFYVPTLRAPAGTHTRLLAPFFRTTERRSLDLETRGSSVWVPNAAQAKPVFMDLLHVWERIVSVFRPPDRSDHDAFLFRTFVFASVLAAYAALVLFAHRLGHAGTGAAVGLAALGGPWAICTCYFSTYTAASLVLYLLACAAALPGTCRSGALAGLLAAAVALSNQSLLALLPALPAMTLLSEAPGTFRRRLASLAVLAATFAIVFGVLETAARLDPTVDEDDPLVVVGPITTLRQYLQLGRTDRSDTFPAYAGSLFPELCSYDSVSASLAVLASAVVLVGLCAADLRSPRVPENAAGDEAADEIRARRRALRRSLLAALPGLVGLLVIETKTGPKFSRSYFLCVPFLLLGGAIALETVLRSVGRRAAFALGGVLALAVTVEAGVRLAELDANLGSATRIVRAELAAGRRIVVAARDNYAEELRLLVEPPLPILSAEELDAAEDVLLLLGPPDSAGPLVHFVLQHDPRPTEFAAIVGAAAARAEPVRDIPFFSHLPFLIYEDPFATYATRVDHRLRTDDFRRPAGRATLYRLPPRSDEARTGAPAPHAEATPR